MPRLLPHAASEAHGQTVRPGRRHLPLKATTTTLSLPGAIARRKAVAHDVHSTAPTAVVVEALTAIVGAGLKRDHVSMYCSPHCQATATCGLHFRLGALPAQPLFGFGHRRCRRCRGPLAGLRLDQAHWPPAKGATPALAAHRHRPRPALASATAARVQAPIRALRRCDPALACPDAQKTCSEALAGTRSLYLTLACGTGGPLEISLRFPR